MTDHNEERRERLEALDDHAREQDCEAMDRAIEFATRDALLLLRARLLRIGFEAEKFAVAARGNRHYDPETSELRVWFVVDDLAYSVIGANADGALYCEQKVNGVYEWTTLDDDGKPTGWMREPPPWTMLS